MNQENVAGVAIDEKLAAFERDEQKAGLSIDQKLAKFDAEDKPDWTMPLVDIQYDNQYTGRVDTQKVGQSKARQFESGEWNPGADQRQIGIVESLGNIRPQEKIPFIGGVFEAKRISDVMTAFDTLSSGVKRETTHTHPYSMDGLSRDVPLTDEDREHHEQIIESYLKEVEDLERRGTSFGAGVTKILVDMVPFVTEFVVSGGAASIGREAVKKAAVKYLKKYGKGKMAKAAVLVAGGLAAGATRLPLFVGRIIKNSEYNTEQGQGDAEAAFKAIGDTYIELISEASGEGLLALGAKIPVLNRLFKGWSKSTGGSRVEFLKKMSNKVGYHGILGEIGEERLGDQLRAVTGVQDFGLDGDDNTVLNRMFAAIPSLKQLATEGVAFTVPGVARAGAMAIAEDLDNTGKKAFERVTSENPFSEGQAAEIARTTPGRTIEAEPQTVKGKLESRTYMLSEKGAKLLKTIKSKAYKLLTNKRQPTRSDFKKLGIPGQWSAAERAELAAVVQSHAGVLKTLPAPTEAPTGPSITDHGQGDSIYNEKGKGIDADDPTGRRKDAVYPKPTVFGQETDTESLSALDEPGVIPAEFQKPPENAPVGPTHIDTRSGRKMTITPVTDQSLLDKGYPYTVTDKKGTRLIREIHPKISPINETSVEPENAPVKETAQTPDNLPPARPPSPASKKQAKPKPVKPEPDLEDKAVSDLFDQIRSEYTSKQKPSEPASPGLKNNVKTAFTEAAKGLNEIFGIDDNIGLLPSHLDREKYEKAKGHFQNTWDATKAAGEDIATWIRQTLGPYKDNDAAMAAIKPYVLHFYKTAMKANKLPDPDITGINKTLNAIGIHRYDPSKPDVGTDEQTPRSESLETFSDTVNKLAKTSKTGLRGNNKVFISHIYKRYNENNPGLSLDEFKGKLIEAHNVQLITLAKADIPREMDPTDVSESVLFVNGEVNHFVRILERQNSNWPGGFNENKSSAPTGDAFSNEYSGPNQNRYTAENNKPNTAIFTLSDMVALIEQINLGKIPGVWDKLGSSVAGRFVHTTGEGGKGRIDLRADIAIGPRIVTGTIAREDFDKTLEEMIDQIMAQHGLSRDQIHVKEELVKGKPELTQVTFYEIDENYAAKVLSHEIGHLGDWLQDKTLSRGNVLGRIASLTNYVDQWLEGFPGGEKLLTAEDEKRLAAIAKQLLSKTAEIEIDEEITKETGLTPDDILDIWNNVESDINKKLEDYIKRLDAAGKKSIIREAMKGNVPSELDHLKTKETVKTGRKIKVKQDVKVDAKDIAAKLKELIEAEIVKRKLLDKKAVTEELKALTQWWSPFDTAADKKYTSYRHKSSELYAEAISVLLNNPAALEQKAPNFYRGFFGWLDSKPEVKQAYNAIVEELSAGKSMQRLVKNTHKMLEEGNDKLLQSLQRKAGMFTGWKKGLFNGLVDVAYEIKSRSRKLSRQGKLDPSKNPEYSIENATYSGAEQEAYVTNIKHEIVKALKSKNITWTQFEEYLLHKRIKNERNKMLNPLGWNAKSSGERMHEMREELGPDKFDALESIGKRFWEIRKEYIVSKVKTAGQFAPELVDYISNNSSYVTFQVSKYLDDTYGAGVGAKIHHQIGTLQKITGTAMPTIMKDLALIKAINWNLAKKDTVDVLLKHYNDDMSIEPSKKRWVNNHNEFIETTDPDKRTVMFFRNGKLEAYDVDKWLAIQFDRTNPPVMKLTAAALKALATPFRLLYTGIRPGFWIYNMAKDYHRTIKNVSGLSATRFAGSYLRAIPPAFRSAFGNPDKIVDEMRKGNMLISVADYDGLTSDDRAIERLVSMHVANPRRWSKFFKNPFASIGHNYLKISEAIERIPKIAAYNWLKKNHPEMSKEEQAHVIRTRAGSPPFLNKGWLAPITNNVFLFSNPAIQGWRYDSYTAIENPMEVLWKVTKYSILPKVFQWGLSSGALLAMYIKFGGDDDDEVAGTLRNAKRIMDGASEYDKTNYGIVPMGLTPEGKSVYLRIPQNETDRFFGGIAHKLLNLDAEGGISLLDYTAQQAPGLNPAFDLALAVWDYSIGRNPYDSYRGREVLPDQVFKANNMETHKRFAQYLWNEAGLSMLYKFKPEDFNKGNSLLEKAGDLPVVSDVLSRFIKVSDYGINEKHKKEASKVEAARAREIVMEQSIAEKRARGRTLSSKEQEYADKNPKTLPARQKKTDKINKADAHSRSILFAKSQAERDVIHLKILDIEGPNFDLVPYISADIAKYSKKINSNKATTKAMSAGKKWLKERHVKPQDTFNIYKESQRTEYFNKYGKFPTLFAKGKSSTYKLNLSRMKKRLGLPK